ncbi:MAG: hypothetical protein LDL25_00030 [Hyphomicrobiales bacterium]|nr:hypothetical protein [Hyphomicrobiales bacterium]
MSRAIHATALVIGEKALLLLGASGAGKSALAERLIAEARAEGRFARLVGDDRILLRAEGGRLLAAPHPAITGRIERRGLGIGTTEWLGAAVVTLAVTIEPNPPRLPEPETETLELEGIRLPRLALRADRDLAARAHLVLGRLRD